MGWLNEDWQTRQQDRFEDFDEREAMKNQVNEEQNTLADRASSPRPAPEWEHPANKTIAHRCANGRVRPYPSLLCSMCPEPREELNVLRLCEVANGQDTNTPKAKQSSPKPWRGLCSIL